jgi:hypothetical protein
LSWTSSQDYGGWNYGGKADANRIEREQEHANSLKLTALLPLINTFLGLKRKKEVEGGLKKTIFDAMYYSDAGS